MSGPGASGNVNPSNSANMSQLHIPMMSMVQSNLPVHGPGTSGITSSSTLSGIVQNSSTIGAVPAHQSHASMAIHYAQPHGLLQQGQVSGHLQLGSLQQSNLTPKGTVNQGFVVAGSHIPQREMVDENVPISSHSMNNNDQGPEMNQDPSSAQSEQRLKVEDALNYLDQVKYKFGNQPQVYNDFLDIMKEFKSQSIDTPGVIERVSNLFRGHPELIVGFNTFLPPGYKIEVSLSMVGQSQGYVVTTVQTAGQVPRGGLPPQPQQVVGGVSVSQPIHQMPIRPAVAHSAPTHNGNRIVSSPPPPSLNVASSNNFDGQPSAAFTHSFSSPFVQSAFPSSQSQPVEFNHAINYVNKIKNRFHGQPDKYKQFLDILHTYQKEQRNLKEGLPVTGKHLTEHEVYAQVSKLFENQEDLLLEFGQFLPDATNCQNTGMKTAIDQAKKSVKLNRDIQPAPPKVTAPTKRPPPQTGPPPPKKLKPVAAPTAPSLSISDIEKYGTLHEFALFDKIRYAIKCPQTYESFLRCLKLYNEEIINRVELTNLVQPILGKHSKLFNCFRGFLLHNKDDDYEAVVPPGPTKSDKLSEDQIMEIDYSTCKRLGASYCAVPSNHCPLLCSGRTSLEHDVLNDVWVSFPTWSEDSTFVNSRKTQYEEYIHRCEDERFELDVVIETNASTIRVLELTSKRMQRMTPEELKNFKLDDTLGGTSSTVYLRAIRRLYGEKAHEIIEGLKNAPSLAVPLVLRRLRAKEVEWRDAQKIFNNIWREQMQKFYLKSLDHQGITFKQTDVRTLRPKALINEIETLLEEREESKEFQAPGQSLGAHLSFQYGDRHVLNDACNLLLHHVRRQSGIQKEDKRRIKQILKHFIPDIFNHDRLDLSDDEEEVSPDEQDSSKGPTEYFTSNRSNGKKNGTAKRGNGSKNSAKNDEKMQSEDAKQEKEDRMISTRSNVGRRVLMRKKPGLFDKSHPAAEDSRAAAEKERSRTTRAKTDDDKAQSSDKQSNVKSSSKETPTINIENESIHVLGKDLFGLDLEGEVCDVQVITEKEADDLADIIGEDYHSTVQYQKVKQLEKEEMYVLFYASKSWYVFLRLHQILCERLNKILDCSKDLVAKEKEMGREDPNGPAYLLQLKQPRDLKPESYYTAFLDLVRELLDGNVEPGYYEDTLREMFGIYAYISFTLDKVVANAVRQLQTLVTDELCLKCLDLYHQFHKKDGAGGPYSTRQDRKIFEIMYRKRAEALCENDGCVRIVIFKNQFRMLMELVQNEAPAEGLDENTKKALFLASILHNNSPEALKARQLMGLRPLLLERNKKCESRGRRRKHDYIARIYHRGDMPKYYCRKEPISTSEEMSLDIDLDLLHHPEKYSYMYQKDINTCSVIPPNFISIPPVVRNALLQKPKPLVPNKVMHKKIAELKFGRFDRWYDKWCRRNISADQSKECELWLLSSKGGHIRRTNLSNLEQPPYRSYSKYKSS